MSRKLDDLAPEFRPLAVELLARLCEARIPCVIVDTKRTPEEQDANVAKGVSWTKNSRHLTGHAIDICPYDEWRLNGPDKLMWDEKNPVWQRIGAIGEACGLKWAVVVNGKRKDLGHFEMKRDQ